METQRKRPFIFLQCDIQEEKVLKKFEGRAQGRVWKHVVGIARAMTWLARELRVPLIVTEHCPEQFGGTFPQIRKCYGKDVQVF